MKNIFLRLTVLLFTLNLFAQTSKVSVVKDVQGMRLQVDGKPFIVNGMNWDYIPIGTNYNYSLWKQSDDVIKAALDAEMGLLKNMGVNAVRQYTGIQPKWVTYIYETYGIYTMLNHSFGRYGLTLNGAWVAVTDYRDKKTQEVLLGEVTKLAKEYKNTPGLLLFLLGNENNYGLFWAGAETEDFPDEEDKKREVGEKRGRPMYKLMNDAAKIMKEINPSNPIAICNGDVLFIDIIAEECKDIDIYGTNMYRGKSFGDAFQVVKDKLNKPILFTEFGADAFNAITNQEDQKMQAFYMVNNWKDIYENASGMGKVGNSLGGFTFQFSDGWWKFGQTKNLDVHDNNASWANGGYYLDMENGNNNMNEEWFGICAKGPTNSKGLYTLYPRAAYYSLKEVHSLNPFKDGVTSATIADHFSKVNLMDAVLRARGDKAAMGGNEKIRLSNLRAEFTTFNTGGSLITTPETADPTANNFPSQLGFDHMQSYYIGVEGNPAPNMRANVNFNIIGNVAENAIDEIFYENRGRSVTVNTDDGNVILNDVNRLNVYNAEFEWSAKDFDLRGFYRTGHYHWGYEGDFFGLYPEANYGPNLDIYGGEILGVEIDGKGAFNGLKGAFGPQLWWGANPTTLLKYSKKVGHYGITGVYHRDVETDINIDPLTGRRILDANQVRSGIIPAFPTERFAIAVERELGNFGITLGGIWAGSPLNGSSYQDVATNSIGEQVVYVDKVKSSDNWGGKAKITYQKGVFNWYAQGAIMGLVANGGADQTQTFTGWKLKDNGSGNQTNFLTGATFSTGNLQIAPNFLYQKPLVAAMPNGINAPGRLRNVIDDPFAVRGNRETTAMEWLFTYDPTPGTWMYEWDNDRAEDAKLAMNLGFVFRHLPTTQDAHIGFLANRNFFAFPNAAPAEDLWEVSSRIVSKINPDFGFIANLFYGNGQANGDNVRLIKRGGGDIRMIYNKLKVTATAKFNDWGPFDYHRDFNLTYPTQLMLDFSTTLGKPGWFILPNTKMGIRGTWRSLDEFSPRYSPNVAAEFATSPTISPVGFGNGSEWEIRTYIHINIGK
ncbi:glycoside hydrolase family 2 TIM barrel-domain containing protein [uncultured Polaribacter sp.]|uniref:glycoside hydrolase family 2 TIM barrel-domain containing protein n=1 Tax=uncultured Polaribacter sp. TaxID=174711 RepID=UPI002605DBDF|nr:glycoside hydrolase family 2 TIM barrel-domain containing protein [uncultured Polaribacter sp.]